MNRKVYKYELVVVDGRNICTIDAPAHAQPLSFSFQGTTPCVWMLVNPYNSNVQHQFSVVCTGHDVPHGFEFVETSHTLFRELGLVLHLFWRAPQ